MKIENVILPCTSSQDIYDVELVLPGSINVFNKRDLQNHKFDMPPGPSLILPSLCHPHIHLDKAFILTSNPSRQVPTPAQPQQQGNPETDDYLPDYSDLAPQSGTFKEALAFTSEAKSRYTIPDLLLRGSQLIAESIRYGVTCMRAFVEVDHVTRFKCVDAAVTLKSNFASRCHVQICIFAQDPVMSGEFGLENQRLIEEALDKYGADVDVLGSTPYVEDSFENGLKNVEWAVDLSLAKGLHLDFHLDYNLDPEQRPMVFDVVDILKSCSWNARARGNKRIVLGHCTRMTLLENKDLDYLKQVIGDLPISFVGLPTSDLFMMGRPDNDNRCGGIRPRGTLQVLDLIRNHGLEACIGVNNVGNAFTPWGDLDPLRLASLCVGLYQSGTSEDAEILYSCISGRAKRAIGIQSSNMIIQGSDNDGMSRKTENDIGNEILLIKSEAETQLEYGGPAIPARLKLGIRDVVWDPPHRELRSSIIVHNL